MGWEGATSPFLPCSYYHMVVDGWSQIFPRSSSQDWLTYTLVNRVSSIVLLMRGAGPVFPSTVTDKGESLLPGLLQVAVLMGGHLSLAFTTTWQMRRSSRYMTLKSPGSAHPCACLQDQLCCAAQTRHRASSPGCCSWWGLGQFPCLPQEVSRGGVNHLILYQLLYFY